MRALAEAVLPWQVQGILDAGWLDPTSRRVDPGGDKPRRSFGGVLLGRVE